MTEDNGFAATTRTRAVTAGPGAAARAESLGIPATEVDGNDIVAVDDQVIDTPDLQVPHPRAAERLFVLQPLCDVWPEAMVGDGLTAAEALSAVSGQVADLVAADW